MYRLLFLCLLLVSTQVTALDIFDPWTQGALIRGKVNPGHSVQFKQQPVKVTAEGFFVIGLGRDAASKVTLIETLPNGQSLTHRFSVKQRKYKEQRIEGVPKRTVDIPPDQLERIGKENRLIGRARRQDSDDQHYRESFIWPLIGPITGVYGSRRFYNGKPRRPHYGIDIAAPQGTPIKAPAAGTVTLVHKDMYFSGGTIILDHGHGVSSTFIHLHKSLVKKGDVVSQGDIIAEVGSTGRSTGPHLHWGMNWFKQRLDPQLLVGPMPEQSAQR